MHKDQATNRLKELCYQGIAVILKCSKMSKVKELFKEFSARYPDMQILAIHSHNAMEAAQQAFLLNPNKEAPKYQMVIHSPVIEQGMSITAPHFKQVVGFCNAGEGTGTPDAFSQMLFRSRVVEKISVHCDPRQDNKSTDYQDYILEQAARFKVAAKPVNHDGKKGWFFEETDDVVLAAKAKATEAAAKNNTIGNLYGILAGRMGCAVNIVHNDQPSLDGKEIIRGGKEKRKAEDIEQTLSAAPLTNPAYDDLKEKRDLSQSEHYQLKRHKLEKEFCINLDSVQTDEDRGALFKMWSDGRGAKPVHGIGEAVLSSINTLAITRYLLENRSQTSESHGFRTRWLIRSGLLKSLHVSFDHDTGEFEFDPGFKFRYADLKDAWWFKFACENRDAVNGSSLGARMKGKAPSEKEIGMWIRAMGIKLKLKMDRTPTSISLKKKKSESDPRKRIRFHTVDQKSMQPLLTILRRRWKNGSMPWQPLAEKYLDDQAQTEVSMQAYSDVQVESASISTFASQLLATIQNVIKSGTVSDQIGIDWLAILLHTTFDQVVSAAHELRLNVVEAGELCYISV
jgi:hypothetical protein